MSSRYWQILSYSLFGAVFLLILGTFNSYGLTWDEDIQKTVGEDVIRWYLSGFQDSSSLGEWHGYGGFFEVVAQLSTRVLPFGVFEDRHLVTALFGLAGVVTVYKLGSLLSGPIAGFFSALFLVATPVFYGHMYNNSKDIPFAVLFVLSLYYTLASLSSLPHPSKRLLLKLGIVTGLAMGTRVAGLQLLGYLAVAWGFWLLSRLLSGAPRGGRETAIVVARLAISFAAVWAVAWGVMLVWWPWGQLAPLTNPWRGLTGSASFYFPHPVLFGGEYVPASDLPPSYVPTWFAVSMPEFYLVALLGGLALSLAWLRRNRRKALLAEPTARLGLLLLSLAAPVAAVIVLGSTLYDGIRHFLFLVPILAVLAGVSMAAIVRSNLHRGARAFAAALIAVSVTWTIADMIQLHPYQYIFFNRLAGGGLEKAASQFETDYWGMSYREGVEWLEANYHPASVPVRVANNSNDVLTGYFLAKTQDLRERFVTVPPQQSPDLFLSTTRWQGHKRVEGEVLHIVERMNTPLLYVVEVRRPDRAP